MRLRTHFGIAGTFVSILTISWISVKIACACIPAREELAWELDLSPKDDMEITTPKLNDAFNKKYKGHQLQMLPPLKTGRQEECQQVSELQLDCKNWLKTGLLWREGLLVSYFTDSKGTVDKVEVSDTLGIPWL